MLYSQVKQAIQESNRSTVEELLARTDGENVIVAALECEVNVETIDEAYQGKYATNEDFAQEICESIYDLGHEGWHPANYIDWERVARDLMMDYCEHNGYYFRMT